MPNCPICGHFVAYSARWCPDCGARNPGDKYLAYTGLYWLFVAVFAVWGVLAYVLGCVVYSVYRVAARRPARPEARLFWFIETLPKEVPASIVRWVRTLGAGGLVVLVAIGLLGLVAVENWFTAGAVAPIFVVGGLGLLFWLVDYARRRWRKAAKPTE